MGTVTNLNRFRKTKAKEQARRKADDNAAKHGLTKAERDLAKARAEKAKRDLDGHETE